MAELGSGGLVGFGSFNNFFLNIEYIFFYLHFFLVLNLGNFKKKNCIGLAKLGLVH